MKKTIVVLLFMASLGLFSVLVAGEVYVSPHGSDRNAGTKEAPYLTLNRAIKQAREWRRLNRPEAAGGICICLEDGVYAQSVLRLSDRRIAARPILRHSSVRWRMRILSSVAEWQ